MNIDDVVSALNTALKIDPMAPDKILEFRVYGQ